MEFWGRIDGESTKMCSFGSVLVPKRKKKNLLNLINYHHGFDYILLYAIPSDKLKRQLLINKRLQTCIKWCKGSKTY